MDLLSRTRATTYGNDSVKDQTDGDIISKCVTIFFNSDNRSQRMVSDNFKDNALVKWRYRNRNPLASRRRHLDVMGGAYTRSGAAERASCP